MVKTNSTRLQTIVVQVLACRKINRVPNDQYNNMSGLDYHSTIGYMNHNITPQDGLALGIQKVHIIEPLNLTRRSIIRQLKLNCVQGEE